MAGVIPTLEQVTSVLTQLKARKYEISEEQKIVDFQIGKYSGVLELLQSLNKDKGKEHTEK